MNLVTPEARAKYDLLFNKLASGHNSLCCLSLTWMLNKPAPRQIIIKSFHM
jgi:hypothetical protein